MIEMRCVHYKLLLYYLAIKLTKVDTRTKVE